MGGIYEGHSRADDKMNHLDLFSGIGGFALAALWVWGVKHKIISFVEPDKQCQTVLKRHFPGVPIADRIEGYQPPVLSGGIVSGGDPCPIRSKAKSIWRTKHPDLSGYFLAVVGKCGAEWVLRENVPAPDDKDFSTALEVLGYGTVIIRTDANSYTGQNRKRDIIVGCLEETKMREFRKLYFRSGGNGNDKPKYENMETATYPCLTTHPARYDSRDGYIWDGSGKLRSADQDERTRLTGFPDGWLDGLSKTATCRLTGNALVPQVVVPIMEAIKEIEDNG